MQSGLLIKKMREAKNLSKEQVADFLKISLNTYKKIEYCQRSLKLEEVEILSQKLEFNHSILFTTITSNEAIDRKIDPADSQKSNINSDSTILKALAESLDKLAIALNRI
ncbi:MAG: helix-turn-helix transcriptional regulator [Saprospiraceae bacterium]